jgi:hypothetical protein
MIGAEILLSLATIGLTVYEAKGQDRLLQNVVSAQGRADEDLKSVGEKLGTLDSEMRRTADAVTNSAIISKNINEALQSQLRIVAQEQKQRTEELGRKPEPYALVNGVRLDAKEQVITANEFSDTKAVYEIVVQNAGNLALLGGLLRIAVDDPKIKLSALGSSSVNLPSDLAKSGNSIVVPLARLNHTAWQLVTLTVEYPQGILPFNIYLVLDGDNLPLTTLGGITVRPPKPPNPFVPPK